ncbi:MAG: hypothetical protein NTV70_15025 [Acidobacteria bacterium]|nr:hypothetical protein [Acidobacteriota bacterium]
MPESREARSVELGLRTLPVTFTAETGWVVAATAGLRPAVEVINALAQGNPSRLVDFESTIAGVRVTPHGTTDLAFSAHGETAVVGRRDVTNALAQLVELRGGQSVNHLLRPDPVFWLPSSLDIADAADLEPRVAELDQLVAQGAEADALSARRSWLLPELERRGIYSFAGDQERADFLREAGCPVLEGYARAAMRLWDYYRSPERARVFSQRPEKLLGSLVSVEWFRRPQVVPDGWPPNKWLTLCEFTFNQHVHHDPVMILFPEGGRTYRLGWQAEAEAKPALVWARADEA